MVCRRFEVHDVNSAVLLHIVQNAVRQAQEWIMGVDAREKAATRTRFENSGRVRLVIDDFSALKDIYTDVREDPIFLPFLLFYLGREGVTVLIIDTHAGGPDFVPPEFLETELRTLVHQRLYTWRVSFFGEHRVAIAAIPPISKRLPALVRELKWHAVGDKNAVDPHFDMYTGLEKGKPTPVPLEVSLFSEAPTFDRYLRQEDAAFRRLFTPRRRGGDPQSEEIIVGQGVEGYSALRDACHLLRDTRLAYTLVLQIDEFWGTEGETSRRSERSPNRGALRSATGYLNAVTIETDGTHQMHINPFGVFRRNAALSDNTQRATRANFFKYPGYDNDVIATVETNRVPFTWDFSFLLYRCRPWEVARKKETSFSYEGQEFLVADVETSNEVSWRKYLGACRAVAQSEALSSSESPVAFDLSLLGPESLPSLILEVWFSEIYTTKRLTGTPGNRAAEAWAQGVVCDCGVILSARVWRICLLNICQNCIWRGCC